jgi:toluene monooxygenase system protein E
MVLEKRQFVTGQRTYWHLTGSARKPTDYEIATSQLLYYGQRGFAVKVPLGAWYERYQRGSPLQCREWDAFRDPRETTYAKYTALQSAKQAFVDGLLRSVDAAYDSGLRPDWVELLGRLVAPMRYPVHGLQMVASYVGAMAPGGRVVVCSLFGAADEMRRVQIIAYRVRQLQKTYADFGQAAKTMWERDAAWQPTRELIERLLVTYDWGEALVALNLVVKPAFDDLLVTRLGRCAQSCGDDVLAKLLFSVNEDCSWHGEWVRSLVVAATADRQENRAAIDSWTAKWQPMASKAMAALAPLLDGFERKDV